MGKEIVTQNQETQSPKQDKPKAKHPKTHINQINKDQTQQILKAAREKQQVTHKGIPIRITADLSIETLQARREWQDILKVMKENNLQPRLLYPARISFGIYLFKLVFSFLYFYMPGEKFMGHIVVLFLLFFLWNLHNVFHSGYTNLHSH